MRRTATTKQRHNTTIYGRRTEVLDDSESRESSTRHSAGSLPPRRSNPSRSLPCLKYGWMCSSYCCRRPSCLRSSNGWTSTSRSKTGQSPQKHHHRRHGQGHGRGQERYDPVVFPRGKVNNDLISAEICLISCNLKHGKDKDVSIQSFFHVETVTSGAQCSSTNEHDDVHTCFTQHAVNHSALMIALRSTSLAQLQTGRTAGTLVQQNAR